MTTSESATCSASIRRSRSCSDSETSFAYPPSVSASESSDSSSSHSTNRAPRLSTCSLTAGRISNASTTAPRRRAVAMAWRPATPAPSTNTRAGAIVPAAVVSMGKNFPDASAPRSTAVYPAIVLKADRASIRCAFVVRGISSIATAVTPDAARRSKRGPLSYGDIIATQRAPDARWAGSSKPSGRTAGGLTLRTIPASRKSSAGDATTSAPASRYSSSVK